MSEHEQEKNTILDEFRTLGDNLKSMLQSAWESEERKKLQSDLESGMKELGNALNEAAADFQAGEVGQNIRREVDEISDRVRSGEMEKKAREEILKALKLLNAELEKASTKFAESEAQQEE